MPPACLECSCACCCSSFHQVAHAAPKAIVACDVWGVGGGRSHFQCQAARVVVGSAEEAAHARVLGRLVLRLAAGTSAWKDHASHPHVTNPCAWQLRPGLAGGAALRTLCRMQRLQHPGPGLPGAAAAEGAGGALAPAPRGAAADFAASSFAMLCRYLVPAFKGWFARVYLCTPVRHAVLWCRRHVPGGVSSRCDMFTGGCRFGLCPLPREVLHSRMGSVPEQAPQPQVPETVRRISGLDAAAAMRPMVACEDPWRYRNKVCRGAGEAGCRNTV